MKASNDGDEGEFRYLGIQRCLEKFLLIQKRHVSRTLSSRVCENGISVSEVVTSCHPHRLRKHDASTRTRAIEMVSRRCATFSCISSGGVPCEIESIINTNRTTMKDHFFETMSKRRRGYPSETQVKRGVRIVHGSKLLEEKLGRNDLCPCGSGRRFKNCCLKKGCF